MQDTPDSMDRQCCRSVLERPRRRHDMVCEAQKVHAAVAAEHSGGPSREELIQENQALREENTQLWNWLSLTIEFPLVKQHEFSAVALAMGLSLTQIAVLLALLLGAKAAPARSTVHRWVQAAAASRPARSSHGWTPNARPWGWSVASMRSSSTAVPCWWALNR